MITIDIQLLSNAFNIHWSLGLLLIVLAVYEIHLKHELLAKGMDCLMILAQMALSLMTCILSFYYDKKNG